MVGGTTSPPQGDSNVRFPESWSSTSLAKKTVLRRRQDIFVLDSAFALIEGHPRPGEGQGSFDSAGTSLREVSAPLRMTEEARHARHRRPRPASKWPSLNGMDFENSRASAADGRHPKVLSPIVPMGLRGGSGRWLPEGGWMTIGSISAAGLSQADYSSSGTSQLQQLMKTLQSSLASGDLGAAQTAFQALQKALQGEAAAGGSSLASNSQLSNDLTTLGSALGSGDVASAQSAFASVQSDLKSSASPALANEMSAAAESGQLVAGLLSTLDGSSGASSGLLSGLSSGSDPTTSLLQSVYGSGGKVNVVA